jgi:hypothetical protein
MVAVCVLAIASTTVTTGGTHSSLIGHARSYAQLRRAHAPCHDGNQVTSKVGQVSIRAPRLRTCGSARITLRRSVRPPARPPAAALAACKHDACRDGPRERARIAAEHVTACPADGRCPIPGPGHVERGGGRAAAVAAPARTLAATQGRRRRAAARRRHRPRRRAARSTRRTRRRPRPPGRDVRGVAEAGVDQVGGRHAAVDQPPVHLRAFVPAAGAPAPDGRLPRRACALARAGCRSAARNGSPGPHYSLPAARARTRTGAGMAQGSGRAHDDLARPCIMHQLPIMACVYRGSCAAKARQNLTKCAAPGRAIECGAHQGTVTSAQLLSSTLGGSRAVSASVSSARPAAAGPAFPALPRAPAPAGAPPAAAPLPSPARASSHAQLSGSAMAASRELMHSSASCACPPARFGLGRAGPPLPGAPGAGARPKPSRAARAWPASAGALARADGPDAVKACSTEQAAAAVHDALEWPGWAARRRSACALTQVALGRACSSSRTSSGGVRARFGSPGFKPVLGRGRAAGAPHMR